MISPYVIPGLRFDNMSSHHRNILKKISPTGTMTKIEMLVCDYYEISAMLFRSKRRDRHIVWPRHVYYYLCYHYTHYTLKQIAKSIGVRDHTTIRNGMLTVNNMISTNPNLKIELLFLQNKVTNIIS